MDTELVLVPCWVVMKNAKCLLMSLTLGAALLTSCAQFGYQKAAAPGEVEHIVMMWLKKKGDAATRAQIIATAQGFKDIPGIVALSAGEPIPSKRPVVDSSFDVAIVIRFKDKAALDAYEKNPKHVKAVTEVLKPAVGKLVVHDYTVK